jgi:hypothetical protein
MFFFFIRITSHFLADSFSEQPRGTDEQHDDQHRKHDRVAERRRDIGPAEYFDDSEQHASQHGARDGSDSAQHRCGEGFDARQSAGGQALSVLTIDSPAPDELVEKVRVAIDAKTLREIDVTL